MFSVSLGSECADALTGFTGVATARAEYLHDSPSVCLESRELKKNGRSVKRWFAEQRLVVRQHPTPEE